MDEILFFKSMKIRQKLPKIGFQSLPLIYPNIELKTLMKKLKFLILTNRPDPNKKTPQG